MLMLSMNPWLALIFLSCRMAASLSPEYLHTALGTGNLAVSWLNFTLLYQLKYSRVQSGSQRWQIQPCCFHSVIFRTQLQQNRMFTTLTILFCVVLVAILYYWYFRNKLGACDEYRNPAVTAWMAKHEGIAYWFSHRTTDDTLTVLWTFRWTFTQYRGAADVNIMGRGVRRYRTCCCYHWRCPLWKNVCRQKLHFAYTCSPSLRAILYYLVFKCCFMVEIPSDDLGRYSLQFLVAIFLSIPYLTKYSRKSGKIMAEMLKIDAYLQETFNTGTIDEKLL